MCPVFVSTIDFASQSETHPWHQSWQKMYWQFHFLTDRQQALFSHSVFYHIYSKTLNQCCFPCAVTKIQALTTISMRASWCVTPARAQTEQFTAQRPTNKRFHIYPPPSLGQLRSWMESRVLGAGGSQGSIGEPVLGTLCCRISWLCVLVVFLACCDEIRMALKSCLFFQYLCHCLFVTIFSDYHGFQTQKSLQCSNMLLFCEGDATRDMWHLLAHVITGDP